MTNRSHAEGLLKDCRNAGLLTENHHLRIQLGGIIYRDPQNRNYTILYHAKTFNEMAGFLAGMLFAHRQIKTINQ